MKSNDTRYGTVAVLIHWISALLILVLLGSGFRSGFVDDTETKAAVLRIHVPVAMLVLILTIGRLIWWWRFDRKPLALAGAPHWQQSIARWTHRLLYLALLLLLASGITMSVMSGLPFALFGAAEFPDLSTIPPRAGHGIGARVLAALLILHAGAALYHHWFLKDKTLKRMSFGAR